MQYFVFLAALVLIPTLLCLVDRRVKGCRPVLVKLLSMIVVTGFILFGVYFYGQQILTTFRINMKSLTSMKAFFNSRLLIYFFFLFVTLLVISKITFTVVIFKSEKVLLSNVEKTVFLTSIVFDLALVPNIFKSEAFVALFVLATLVELGLVYIKLVFSIPSYRRKEVLA